MNTAVLEMLSENEMLQIIGGGSQWIWIDGKWFLIETLDLGDESTFPPPPPNI